MRLIGTSQRLTLRQAAEFLGISYQTLRNWRSEGRPTPPSYQIGAKVVYRLADLESWMEARRAHARN